MKAEEDGDIRSEYDFTNAVRGKYYERYLKSVEAERMAASTDDLRREIQRGIEQLDRGESDPLDPERIKSESRRRLAQG